MHARGGNNKNETSIRKCSNQTPKINTKSQYAKIHVGGSPQLMISIKLIIDNFE